MNLPIIFTSTETIKRECRSVLLDPNSELVHFLRGIRHDLLLLDDRADARAFHIELVHVRPRDMSASWEVLIKAKKLQGQLVDVADTTKYRIMNNRAFVFDTPYVDGYGDTHLTIAYFRQGISSVLEKKIRNVVKKHIDAAMDRKKEPTV